MKRDDLIFCMIAALCVAISYFATDIYLPAMPTLRTYFSTSTTAIQSTMSIYMIGIVIAQLVIGPIADHFGFRQTIIPLVILLILSSLACAAAESILTLSLGRFFQAISAGGMAVIGRGSFTRYFPKERAASLYIAIIPPVAITSPALAPVIGGLLVHHFNWQSIFLFFAGLSAIILFALVFKYRIGKQPDVETSLHPGFIIKTYTTLLRNKMLLAYLTIIIFTFAMYYAYMTESPFIFHSLGYSTQQIGFSYICIAVAFLISTRISIKLLKYFSYQFVLTIGFTLSALGLLLLLLLSMIMTLSMLWILIPTTLYTGSIGFINPIIMSKSINLFPKKTGYASSLTGASALLGAALGTQFVDILTHGSIRDLAIGSLILILIAWVVFLFLITEDKKSLD